MTADILSVLGQSALGATLAIMVVLVARPIVRQLFGATIAYGLWMIVPIAIVASLLPAELVYITDLEQSVTVAPLSDNPTRAAAVQLAPFTAAEAEVSLSFANVTTAVLVFWLIGFVVSLGRLAISQYRYVRKYNLQAISEPVHVSEHDHVGPAVIGILRPRIVVPKNFVQLYSELERSLILAHENAHIRSGDIRVNAAAALLKSLNWFNPLVYLAYGMFRVDQELACDERVMRRHGKHRRVYAETLLKSQLVMQTAPVGCAWLPESMHPLKQRVARLASPKITDTRRLLGLVMLGVTVSLSGAGAWSALASHVVYVPSDNKAPVGEQTKVDEEGLELVESLADGRVSQAKAMIAAGADVNYYHRGDGTPLVIAVRQGNKDMVVTLIEAGADVNKAAPLDANPLIQAARRGDVEITQLLLEQGADVNAFVLYDETPLIGAASEGQLAVAELLIQHGADVNLRVKTGHIPSRPQYRSPLGQAELYGHGDVASLLRAHGAVEPASEED